MGSESNSSADGSADRGVGRGQDGKRSTVGEMLRRFRLRKGLTLEQAARLMATSAPVLSRKERGQDQIERTDIRLAIQAYALDPLESHLLWLEAGFVADSPLYGMRPFSIDEVALLLLPHVHFPAFIMDKLAYLHAWNQGLELFWAASQSAAQPLNIIDDLFTQQRRAHMGLRWDAYILRALRIFRSKAQDMINDPQYRALLDHLRARHGALFQEKWNQVEQGAGVQELTLETSSITLGHDFSVGHIDFVATATTWQFPLPGELTIYLPFGPDNLARYARLAETEDLSRVYFAKHAFDG